MTKAKDLDRLLALRESRLQRAEGALATQHARCETARSQAEAAAARILAHRDHQDEDERALLDGLVYHWRGSPKRCREQWSVHSRGLLEDSNALRWQ